MSTRSPFALSSDFVALLHVIASFLALGQVIYILPRQTKAKPALWIFFLVSLVPYLTNIFVIKSSQSSLVHFQTHPVEFIIRNAKADFTESVKKQSQTYTAAHGEYQRRYGLEPPTGFEAWYEFAKAHQSPIIDEFDTIYNAVSPFWKLSGREVLDTITDMHDAPNSELWLCEFSSQQSRTGCSYRHRKFDRNIQLLFNRLLKDLSGVLPDMQFLVNHLDEPRVIIPPESLGNNEPSLTDISGKPIWKTLTKFCFPQSKRRNAKTEHITKTSGLPFITDTSSAMDLCQHPEYNATHGLSMSPTSFRPIEGAVPILSTGALSTMGDILYPSPAYNESEFQYSDAHDVDWDEKWNNLYWSGSTTGGFAADDQWHHYHRQRFVELAQNLQKRDHTYLQEKNGVISRVKSSFLNSRLFDVAFTRIFQCTKKPCHDQRAYFRTKSWTDKDQPLRSRLVFDLDGNGISGRYYKLLASKSVPLKQTLLREWHDDRLAPWVHYIPVSQSMDELPELVTYLTSTVSGQKRAEEIAEQGREWFARAFRDVDLTIYTYRLLLELARLQDPDRPAG